METLLRFCRQIKILIQQALNRKCLNSHSSCRLFCTMKCSRRELYFWPGSVDRQSTPHVLCAQVCGPRAIVFFCLGLCACSFPLTWDGTFSWSSAKKSVCFGHLNMIFLRNFIWTLSFFPPSFPSGLGYCLLMC